MNALGPPPSLPIRATDGIGRHTARKIASDGHGLIVHGRRPDAGADLESDLKGRGAAFAHYLNADLSDLGEVEGLAEAVARTTDRIDVLVNNAGVYDPDPPLSAQGFEATWAVNVMAPFLLTRRLLPLIARGDKPRIVTTSSISRSSSLPSLTDLFATGDAAVGGAHRTYSCSKLGDAMFTKKLAQILSSRDESRLSAIKCLTMDPGTVNTKMLLAGWGACGISVDKADNTYKLAATEYGARQESGSYHFGFGSGGDAEDQEKLDSLWGALEEHTGCTYSDIGGSVVQ